jgi:hypothetical protein
MVWIGTAISLAGTVIAIAGSGDLRFAGEITALSAEPIMLTGTGLWIAGAARRPFEVPPGRPGLDVLGGAPPLPRPTTATLSFRF